MQRFIISVAAVLALTSTPVRADVVVVVNEEARSPGRNVLLFNPGDLLNGVISFEYEHALNGFFGLTGGLSIFSFRGPLAPVDQATYIGFAPELGARIHLIERAPAGLWFGPTFSAGDVISRDGLITRTFAYGLGAALGYNVVLDNFVFQIGVGSGFYDYGDGVLWAPRVRFGLGGVF